jgi:hypothetical protein
MEFQKGAAMLTRTAIAMMIALSIAGTASAAGALRITWSGDESALWLIYRDGRQVESVRTQARSSSDVELNAGTYQIGLNGDQGFSRNGFTTVRIQDGMRTTLTPGAGTLRIFWTGDESALWLIYKDGRQVTSERTAARGSATVDLASGTYQIGLNGDQGFSRDEYTTIAISDNSYRDFTPSAGTLRLHWSGDESALWLIYKDGRQVTSERTAAGGSAEVDLAAGTYQIGLNGDQGFSRSNYTTVTIENKKYHDLTPSTGTLRITRGPSSTLWLIYRDGRQVTSVRSRSGSAAQVDLAAGHYELTMNSDRSYRRSFSIQNGRYTDL